MAYTVPTFKNSFIERECVTVAIVYNNTALTLPHYQSTFRRLES